MKVFPVLVSIYKSLYHMGHWQFKPISQLKCSSSTGEMIFSNSDTNLKRSATHSLLCFLSGRAAGRITSEKMQIKTTVPEAALLSWLGGVALEKIISH